MGEQKWQKIDSYALEKNRTFQEFWWLPTNSALILLKTRIHFFVTNLCLQVYHFFFKGKNLFVMLETYIQKFRATPHSLCIIKNFFNGNLQYAKFQETWCGLLQNSDQIVIFLKIGLGTSPKTQSLQNTKDTSISNVTYSAHLGRSRFILPQCDFKISVLLELSGSERAIGFPKSQLEVREQISLASMLFHLSGKSSTI